MKHDELTQIIEQVFEKVREIRATKNKTYTLGTDDAFRNFRTAGEELNISKEACLWIYLKKHLNAIVNHIKHDSAATDPEGIDSRIDDCVVYLLLLRGMYAETLVRTVESEMTSDGSELVPVNPLDEEHPVSVRYEIELLLASEITSEQETSQTLIKMAMNSGFEAQDIFDVLKEHNYLKEDDGMCDECYAIHETAQGNFGQDPRPDRNDKWLCISCVGKLK